MLQVTPVTAHERYILLQMCRCTALAQAHPCIDKSEQLLPGRLAGCAIACALRAHVLLLTQVFMTRPLHRLSLTAHSWQVVLIGVRKERAV